MVQPIIDYEAISTDISMRCFQLLQNVNVNTISDSFDAVKDIVEIAIEKYSFGVSEYWMTIHSDAETSQKIKFTDVDHGYEILLKKWVDQNPFKAELPMYPDDIVESYEEYVANLNKKAIAVGALGTVALGTAYGVCKSHLASQTASVVTQAMAGAVQVAPHSAAGTTCAKGWLIFGNPIVVIAAELIGIAAVYAVVKYQKKNKRQQIDIQICELEERLKMYKQELITTLTRSAVSYLQNAEAYSNNILDSF